jgi:hypothetical protein
LAYKVFRPWRKEGKDMSGNQFVRFGGVALQVAGIILGVALLLHPDEAAAGFVPGTYWTVIHVALGIGFMFLSLGLVALVLKFEVKIGVVPSAFVLLLSALSGLLAGLMLFLEGFVMPSLANSARLAAALDPSGPLMSGGFWMAVVAAMVAYSFSAVIVGIALIKLIRGQWYIGVCFLGIPFAAFTPPLPHIVGTVGGIVFGFSCVMLGRYILRTGS